MAKSTTSSNNDECPKRPLSAYNMFFQLARKRVVGEVEKGPYTRAEIFAIDFDKSGEPSRQSRPHRKVHGKISFVGLAKVISTKWNELPVSEKKLFEERADQEKRKYAIELEEWLVRQDPTPQIKKRLGALRRGSLGKFIKAHHDPQEPTKPPPTSYHDPPSCLSLSPRTLPSSYTKRSLEWMTAPPSHPHARRVSNDQGETYSRHKIQVQRANNLERLYRMQIQLYNEQVRLQSECDHLQDSAYPSRDYHYPPPPPPPFPLPPMTTHIPRLPPPRTVSSVSDSASTPPESPYRSTPVHYVVDSPRQERACFVPTEPWHGQPSRMIDDRRASPSTDDGRDYLDAEYADAVESSHQHRHPRQSYDLHDDSDSESDLASLAEPFDFPPLPPVLPDSFDVAVSVDAFAEY